LLVDGIHDLGGMQGLGAVDHSPAEPVFHHRWEAVARALLAVVAGAVEASGGEFRHSIERMELAIPWKCGDFLLADFVIFRLLILSNTSSFFTGVRGYGAWVPRRAPGGAGPGLPALPASRGRRGLRGPGRPQAVARSAMQKHP